MDSGKQQIIHYFIEEAKEHLDTLEKGLLDLPAVMEDSERINEMFRAAHSVKGGAAMLGFDSIQKTAHRLEDCFKILKENPVPIDSQLETMFLKGCDTLKDLVERLQGPFGLQEEEGTKAVQAAEPNFVQLLNYLNRLVTSGPAKAATSAPVKTLGTEVANQVTAVLKQMLQLFKQGEAPGNRQQIQGLGDRLLSLVPDIPAWQSLVQLCQQAIANPKNSFTALAPVVIKELKQGIDLLVAGKAGEVAPSAALQKMALVTASAAPATAPEAPKQVTVPLDSKAAAKAILQSFNRQQVIELVKLLHAAVKASS